MPRQPLQLPLALLPLTLALALLPFTSSLPPVASAANPNPTTTPSERIFRDIPYRPDLSANPNAADPYAAEKCRLDLYIPPHPNTPPATSPTTRPSLPTLVYFHAGGLTGGSRHIPESLKNHGLIIVAPSYRLSPNVKAPTYIQDAAAAVAWTAQNIAQHGGDPNRIYLSGHSAGGYLALMLGLDKRWLAPHNLDPDRLAGLAPLSPQVITHFAIRAERGLKDTQPLIDDLAPLFHVRNNCPPVLLITGDRDTELLGRYEENAYLWRMFQLVKHPNAQLHEVQGFDHGQMLDPGLQLLLRFIQSTEKQRQ